MKKKLIIILSVLAVLTLLVAACTTEPEEPEMMDDPAMDEELNVSETENDDDMGNSSDSTDSSDDESSSDAGEGSDQSGSADEQSDQEMTDEEMVAFIEEKLDGQHDLDRILNADKTYDEWVITIDRMVGYGADINEEEKELIINWLLERTASMMDESEMAEEEMAMTDEEMIAFIEEKLDGKHDLDRVLNADKNYDEWVTTIDRMIDYGADINEEEKELIINWLLER